MPWVRGSSPLIRPIYSTKATFMQLGYFSFHVIWDFFIKALFEASFLALI